MADPVLKREVALCLRRIAMEDASELQPILDRLSTLNFRGEVDKREFERISLIGNVRLGRMSVALVIAKRLCDDFGMSKRQVVGDLKQAKRSSPAEVASFRRAFTLQTSRQYVQSNSDAGGTGRGPLVPALGAGVLVVGLIVVVVIISRPSPMGEEADAGTAPPTIAVPPAPASPQTAPKPPRQSVSVAAPPPGQPQATNSAAIEP